MTEKHATRIRLYPARRPLCWLLRICARRPLGRNFPTRYRIFFEKEIYGLAYAVRKLGADRPGLHSFFSSPLFCCHPLHHPLLGIRTAEIRTARVASNVLISNFILRVVVSAF